MKRLFIVLLSFLFVCFIAKSQTATDFTATDCDGITNNLFTELNNGKIVVLVWVEPCVGCINDAKAAYDAMMNLNASNPGKVKYWLIDDIGDTPCSQLASWAISSNIITENIQLFSNAGNIINEMNYGGLGMPHVVVVGNSSHHIYLNLLNGVNDGGAISNAIVQAITNSVNDVKEELNSVLVFPNPTNNVLHLKIDINQPSDVEFEVINVLGEIIEKQKNTQSDKNDIQLILNNELPNGNYFLKIKSTKEYHLISFSIFH